MTAALTHTICGNPSSIFFQLFPSSFEAYSFPLRVPKINPRRVQRIRREGIPPKRFSYAPCCGNPRSRDSQEPPAFRRAINTQTAFRRAAKLVRFHRNDVHAVSIVRMHQHRKSQSPTAPPPRDVLPRIAAVVRTIQSPVVFAGTIAPAGDSCSTILCTHCPNSGYFSGMKNHAYSIVPRLPGVPAVLSAVDSARGHSHVHPLFVFADRARWCAENSPPLLGIQRGRCG